MPVASLREKLDGLQQRHVVLAFPYAVHKRFTEDRGKHFAALISYYGFFSLFPLLLAFVSLLGVVLRGRPDLQADILDSALGRFPVLGTDLADEGARSGSGWALAFGPRGRDLGGPGRRVWRPGRARHDVGCPTGHGGR